MGMVCVMLFVAHPKTAPFVAIAGGTCVLVAIGVKLLDIAMETSTDFRLRRILVWLHPEQYSDEGGFQVMQGLYAIGSGGFFGKGLGNSAQKMIIPEVQNDMILSIICEELGFLGALLIIALFIALILRGYWIALKAPDRFSTVLAAGLTTLIAVQTVLNLCVVTNILPSTGIALPFFSYGGTALAVNLGEMGILLGISRMRNRASKMEDVL